MSTTKNIARDNAVIRSVVHYSASVLVDFNEALSSLCKSSVEVGFESCDAIDSELNVSLFGLIEEF